MDKQMSIALIVAAILLIVMILLYIFLINCPDKCSGNGKCNKLTKKCTCDDNYSESNCGTHIVQGWQQMGKYSENLSTWSCGKGSCFDGKARSFSEILDYLRKSQRKYAYVIIDTKSSDPANVYYLVAQNAAHIPKFDPDDMDAGYQVWKRLE